MASPSDSFRALVDRVHQGSEEAAREFVQRYGTHIRAVVRRRMHPKLRPYIDSEDFVQSVWGSLVRIGPRLDGIERPEQLIALLAKMAQNKVIDEVRRRTGTQKHQLVVHGAAGQLEGATPVTAQAAPASPSQLAIARERWERILDGEPPTSRQILELRLSGCTQGEIAARLSVCERTVGRTVARLLQRESETPE